MEKLYHTIDTCTLEITTDRPVLESNSPQMCWAMVKLKTNPRQTIEAAQRLPMDFVVVIDTSISMKQNNKLSQVIATLEYMLEVLTDQDRFSLVQFSDKATLLVPLIPATEDTKFKIRRGLHTLQARGNTNLADGLFVGLKILESRTERILPQSRLFLLTDGHSNRGFTQGELLDTLKKRDLHEGISFHCFGYGKDHCSASLQAIAFCSPGGLYHYVESPADIAPCFGECLAGIFSTVSYSIRLQLEAFDGCRFIEFHTTYSSKTLKSMKMYWFQLGSLSIGEERTLLMKLSIRNVPEGQQALFRATLEYSSTINRCRYVHEQTALVERIHNPHNVPYSLDLDKNINRIISVEAIDSAIKDASVHNYGTAQKTLLAAIHAIQASSSAQDVYCKDLVCDLEDCLNGMADYESFVSSGIYQAVQYSTMHSQERSVGVLVNEQKSSQRSSANYGYSTLYQSDARKHATEIASGYLADLSSQE